MAELRSAGLLVFRRKGTTVEVLLVHPGGPFWKRKDLGTWSLPKGEYEGEDALVAAKREFQEETGLTVEGDLISLGEIRQPSRKIITLWAIEGDVDAGSVRSNTFIMEWPPKSGQKQEFPEIDKADWFPLREARSKILKGQVGFLERLATKLGVQFEEDDDSAAINGTAKRGRQKSLF